MEAGQEPAAGVRCDQLVELVTDHLEDALDPRTRTELDAHLAACSGCATYLEQIRTTARLLGHVTLLGLSDAARSRLDAAFRELFR